MTALTLSRRAFLGASGLALAGAGCGAPGSPAPGADPIIDIHQHTSYGGNRDKEGNVSVPGRTDEQLIAHQRTMGVTRTILLPAGRETVRGSTHEGKSNGLLGTCTGNQACARLAGEHPDLFSFGSNEVPDLPDAPEVIATFLRAGAVVIGEQKFGVECDSPEMQRLYALAAEFQVPILMHWQHKTYNAGFERFGEVLRRHPKTLFIGHAQTWWANIDRNHDDPSVLYPKTKVTAGGLTDRYLSDYPNLYGDMSANSGQGALTRDPDHARGFLERHQDRLVFGSDCADTLGQGPGCIGATTIGLIRSLAPSRAVERKILAGNAKSLFRLPGRSG